MVDLYDKFVGRQTFRIFPPDHRLKNHIKKYEFRSNLKQNIHNIPITPFQNGNIDLAIHYNNSKVLYYYNGTSGVSDSLLIGLFDQGIHPLVKAQVNEPIAKWVIITFTFTGLLYLLDIKSTDLINRAIKLELILGTQPVSLLKEKLYHSLNDWDRVQILNDFFLSKIKKNSIQKVSKGCEVLQFVNEKQGRTNIKQVSAEVHLSYRQIERCFKREVGLNIKGYLKIIRLDQACKMMMNYPGSDIQEIIERCGYYDQAHFIHDFKNHFCHSPKKFLKLTQGKFYMDRPYLILQEY